MTLLILMVLLLELIATSMASRLAQICYQILGKLKIKVCQLEPLLLQLGFL